MESVKIYKHIEIFHSILTRLLFKAVSVIVVTIFGLALMFPISFAIFDYPEPSQWRLLLEIQ